MPVVRAWQLGSALVALVSASARAEEPAASGASPVGDTAWALPGIVRVGVPGLAERRVALARSAGYGMTEAQSASDGAHHRLQGSAAVSVVPLSALELALRFDGRYDLHPDDGGGAHGGAVGDPRFVARYGLRAARDVRVGVEVGAWFPGKDAPSLSLDATTVDAKALAAWAPRGGPVDGVAAGFRLDQSGNAAPTRDRIRSGDRLALGLSDFDAVLVGAGLAVPLGRTEILGEVSADLLVGAGAPSIGKSPMRLTAGVRHSLGASLALEGLAEVSPSGRPGLEAADALVPVEPRFSLIFGLRYRLPFDRPVPPAQVPPPAEQPVVVTPTPSAAAAPVTLVVRVSGEDGTPAPVAHVTVRVGETPRDAATATDGSYRFDGLAPGKIVVTVAAEGFVPSEQSVDVGPDTAKAPLEVRLKALPPTGQIRGLIRSFSGKGIPATIHVDPVGTEVKADENGAFTVDIPPGAYQVTIRASRFKEQHRKVHVDKNGVTVINAELFEGK